MSPHKATARIVAPTKHLSSHQRLEMYAQQYWWRIQGAFDEDFTTVQRVLSEKEYVRIRDAYLRECPSVSYTLRNLGTRFAAFVGKKGKSLNAKQKLAQDCATFDWACIDAFDAAELQPITERDIIRKDFSSERLYVQPHVQLLKLNYTVDSFVKSDGRESTREAVSNTMLKKRNKGRAKQEHGALKKEIVFLVVHRKKEKVFMKRLSAISFDVLSKLQQGCTLRKLITLASKEKAVTPEIILETFKEFSALGWLYIKR